VTDPNWDDMIAVGRIVRPHGRKGQVVVASETDFAPDRFRPGAAVWRLTEGRVDRLAIVDSRPHQDRWVVGFGGVSSIDEAEVLRDSELRGPAETRPPLGPQQYYVHDLSGCRVETADGRVVGRVARVDLGAGTPMLVVEGERHQHLTPLADHIRRRVDVSGRLIVIDPPPGLLELNA